MRILLAGKCSALVGRWSPVGPALHPESIGAFASVSRSGDLPAASTAARLNLSLPKLFTPMVRPQEFAAGVAVVMRNRVPLALF